MKKQPQLKTRRDINVQIFINVLKSTRERIHLADVVVSSPRAGEVMQGVSDLLNDACANLDELIEKAEPLLKAGEKAA